MTAPTTGERELNKCSRCDVADSSVQWYGDFAYHNNPVGCFYALCKERDALRADLARVTAERDRLQELSEVAGAFHRKHAFGSLSAPSCLACGRAEPFATTHAELPNIGLCASCATAQREAAGLRELVNDWRTLARQNIDANADAASVQNILDELEAFTPAPEAGRLSGVRIVADETIPVGEAHFIADGKTVGKITDLLTEAPTDA